jgi:CBS-domain-containing membrane protein
MEVVSKEVAAAANKHSSYLGGVAPNDGAQDILLKMVNTKAESLVPSPPLSYSKSGVLHTYGDTPLPEAFNNLCQQRILAMPVVTKGNIKFYGFLDMCDIVNFVTRNLGNYTWQNELEFSQTYNQTSRFNSATVKDVMSFKSWKSSPYHPVDSGYSLFSVFEMLARSGFHRVAVLNAEKQIATVITQSMMLDWIHQNLNLLNPTLRNLSAADMVLHHNVPHLVKSTDRTLLAFEKMTEYDISGLGVVDENGKLTDVISNRDLRGLNADASSIWRLYDSVRDFKTHLKLTKPDTPIQLYTIRSTDTLEHIINLMTTNKIHRVFLVNAHGKPLKCICQRDVLLNLLVKQAEA